MNPPPNHHHYPAQRHQYLQPTPAPAAGYSLPRSTAGYSLPRSTDGTTTYPLSQNPNSTTYYYPLPYASVDASTTYPSYTANAAVDVSSYPSYTANAAVDASTYPSYSASATVDASTYPSYSASATIDYPPSSSTATLTQNAPFPIPESHSINPSIPQPDHSAVPYSDEDYVRKLRNEVIFLHGLWHQGPPNANSYSSSISIDNPIGNPHLKVKPVPSTAFKKKKNPRPRPVSDKPWPVPPEPPAQPETESGWPEFRPCRAASTWVASEEEKGKIWATKVQQKGLDSFQSFFVRNHGSDSESGSEEDEDDGTKFDYLLEVFEGNEELRDYYEKNWENGEFCCLVCGGIGEKVRRKFKNCVALVQHTATISKTKKKKAHRAYGQVICKVLGWNINQLPSISENPNHQQAILQGNDTGNAEARKDDCKGIEANIVVKVNDNEQSDPSKGTSNMREDDTAEKKETSNHPSVLNNPGVEQLDDTSNTDTCKSNPNTAEENTVADPLKSIPDSGDANVAETELNF